MASLSAALVSLPEPRPCYVWNSEMTRQEKALFHFWFIPTDGWPRGLVEFEDGHTATVGYRKIIFCGNEKFWTDASWEMWSMHYQKGEDDGTSE